MDKSTMARLAAVEAIHADIMQDRASRGTKWSGHYDGATVGELRLAGLAVYSDIPLADDVRTNLKLTGNPILLSDQERADQAAEWAIIHIGSVDDLVGLDGVYRVIESGEVLDIADIRFGYDGQTLTLVPVVTCD